MSFFLFRTINQTSNINNNNADLSSRSPKWTENMTIPYVKTFLKLSFPFSFSFHCVCFLFRISSLFSIPRNKTQPVNKRCFHSVFSEICWWCSIYLFSLFLLVLESFSPLYIYIIHISFTFSWPAIKKNKKRNFIQPNLLLFDFRISLNWHRSNACTRNFQR